MDSAQAEADSLALAEAARRDSMVAFPDSLAYANNAGFEVIVNTRADERDAVWLPGGGGIVYASDRTGIFNIYALDLATGRQETAHERHRGRLFALGLARWQRNPLLGLPRRELQRLPHPEVRGRGGRAVRLPGSGLQQHLQGQELGDLFNTGRYAPRLASIGVVPILVLGPTFIGNRFGLDQLSAGAEAAWGDLLGSDNIYAALRLARTEERRGSELELFRVLYEGPAGGHTEDRTYAPRFFIGASQQTINSQIDRGIVDARRDTTSGTLQIVIDDTLRLVPGVTSFTNLSLTQEDKVQEPVQRFRGWR